MTMKRDNLVMTRAPYKYLRTVRFTTEGRIYKEGSENNLLELT